MRVEIKYYYSPGIDDLDCVITYLSEIKIFMMVM